MPKRIDTTVELVDGRTFTVRVLPVDVVAFERHYKIGVAKLEKDDAMLTEHAMFMAWRALTRTGQWSGDFDTFVDQVAGVEDDSGPADPTPPVP